jgi:hypothetical protein
MGLGSSLSKKFKKYTGVSVERAGLAGLTGGLSELHTLGGGQGVIDFVKDPTGAKAAAKEAEATLRAQGRHAEADRLKLEAERSELKARYQPYRDYALTELERLRGQAPGTTERFKQQLAGGSEALIKERDKYGLATGGGTERELQTLTSKLLTDEDIMRQRGISQAAALSTLGTGPELELLRQEGGLSAFEAQLATQAAAAKSKGKMADRKFWLDLGTQAIGGVGGYFLGGAAGGAGGAAAAAGSNTASSTSGAGRGGGSGYATYTSPGGYGSIIEGTGYDRFVNPYPNR